MTEYIPPSDLISLQRAIDKLPAKHQVEVQFAYDLHAESSRRRRRILNLVQEALAQVRLDMKYLLFDLEATRRERDEARQKTN